MYSEVPEIPRKLFDQATILGFQCETYRNQHFIMPVQEPIAWRLVCQKGYWVLQINGVAQMNMTYSEVEKFLKQRVLSHTGDLLKCQ
jgi:hypothetical protein